MRIARKLLIAAALSAGLVMATESSDANFVRQVTQGGLFQVEAGRLAMTQGRSPDVKAFGQHMVDNHGKANADLKALAAKEQISVPADMGSALQAELSSLKQKKGADFDKAYGALMLSDHKADVAGFEKASTSLASPKLRQFATDALPMLRHHLMMAEGLTGAGKMKM